MFQEYLVHNLHWKDVGRFLSEDPHLASLKDLTYVHPLDWWRKIDWKKPGIYILTGGRQLGKSTSTKLLVKNLLAEKSFAPADIFYLPCDQIRDQRELGRVMRSFLVGKNSPFVVIADEITFVKEWDRAVKAMADEGLFRKGFCILTGSDTIVLKEAMQRFPGRRGEGAQTDFHLRPLSFADYVGLVGPKHGAKDSADSANSRFGNYLRCGGHLRAINDLHRHGEIQAATYAVYSQWVAGDFEKRGKNLHYLLSILKSIFETYGTQVTYSSLTQRIGEITKETFIDYCNLLERMDVFFTLQAYDQNRRIGFPKKARKFHCWDPFIFDTLKRWLDAEGVISPMDDPNPLKAESVAAAAFKRRVPTYYFKGKGEIDVVAVEKRKPLALEVKWTKNLRPWDVGELKKFPSAFILTRHEAEGEVDGIATVPLARFLLREVF